jgi:hypothetical protein
MMADLFCNVQSLTSVIKLPFTGEMFSKDWVEGFLDALTIRKVRKQPTGGIIWNPDR